MKRRPFIQRVLFTFLAWIEVKLPGVSQILRYHSRVIRPSALENVKFISRTTKWRQDAYHYSYQVLRNEFEIDKIRKNEPEKFPISVLLTEDYIIHGHIKTPILASSGLALSYSPITRLTLTDSYPLPFSRSRKVAGTIIFIPNIENYFHLMVDYLLPPLCAIIREPECHSHVTFVVQRKFPMVELFSLLLNDLGLSTSVLAIGKIDRVTGGILLFGGAEPRDSGAAFAYPDEMRKFGLMIDRHLPVNQAPGRVFVTRMNATRRRILNEAEFKNLLKLYNIETVELSFDNPLDQVSFFRNAELIISVHGAALTNLIWSKNAKVIEIFPENLRPKHYLNIASQMGLNYKPFIASMGNEREDFEIDIEKFRNFLSHNFE